MKRWSRGKIQDARQLTLEMPARLRAWVRHTAKEIQAKTTNGPVTLIQRSWRWWDGFLRERSIAAGFTLAEIVRKVERLFQEGVRASECPSDRPAIARRWSSRSHAIHQGELSV